MLINPNLTQQETFIYLLKLKLDQQTLDNFRNIKYVIMQGSKKRTLVLAQKLSHIILNINPNYFEPINLFATSNFVAYRIGNILIVSHGMGNITIDCLLHSLTKLLYYAGNTDLEYIRVGTSGGIGVEAGSVIITQQAYMPNLQPYYQVYELDQEIKIPTLMNDNLVQRIIASQPNNIDFTIRVGNSIAADDFYLGQCRYDGAMLPRQDRIWREIFFQRIQKLNIYNFEMESTALAAFCYQAQIPATMIAVTLLNRLYGDQITASNQQLAEYSDRSQSIAINYLISQPK